MKAFNACLIFLLSTGGIAGCAQNPAAQDVSDVDPRRAMQHFYQPIFTPMDCELIGRAQKGEVDEHFPALYFFLDRSHDRVISRDEFFEALVTATDGEKTWLFARMDADGDGGVTPEEYRRFVYAGFDLLDVDQNGDLTEAEVDMASFRRAIKP